MSGFAIRGAGAVLAAGLASVAVPAHALSDVALQAPGASEELEERLRNASLLLEVEDEIDDVQEVLAAARAEYGRLLGVLYSQGHFGGVISISVDGREAAQLSPLRPPGDIQRIVVNVAPGPTYTFSQAQVAPVAPGTELPEGFALGRPARTPVIRDAVEVAVEGWREYGYAKAEAGDQQITARHAQDRVEAAVAIRPGPLVEFGEFTVVGNENVREEAIRRIADFPEGSRFSPTRLDVSTRRLRRTGAFSSVASIEAEEVGQGETLDVTVRVVEEPPRRFGFGAELSTTEGATVSAFWLHRYLFGGAERLRVDGEVRGIGGGTGGTDYTFATTFGRPATIDADTDLYALVQFEELNEPVYSSQSLTLGVGLSRRIRETFSVEAGIGYQFFRDEDDAGVREYSLLTFPIGSMADRRDFPLNPAAGWYAEADITPFVGLNDTAGTGGRLTFDGRLYRGFGADDRVVLAGRFQIGSIVGADLREVPNDYRFYAGGGGTVRGLEYKSLDITLDNGVASGGASFLGLSAEARVGVRENIQIVGFADYGYVGRESFPDGSGEDAVGAGLGLRYITPIGPIRLDIATPITGDDVGESIQVYVGIGQAF